MSLAPVRSPRQDLAFCFPCQPLNGFAWDASAAAGFPEAEAMFALASRCLRDPALAPPTRLQVITYTSAAAYAALLMARGAVPAICLPHSMGLYAALVAAGACDFGPMLRYVIAAGQAIHAFGQGGDFEMASIFGLEASQVEEICRTGAEGAYVANYNAGGHTVISGRRGVVEEACRAALARGCYEARLLGTGVPLHTPLMEPVGARLAAGLAAFPVRAPRLRVLCPSDALPLERDDILPALSRHISRPVRFEQMVRAAAGSGARLILEVGYEKLLSKFVGWTDPEIASRSVASAGALERELRRLAPGVPPEGRGPSACL